VGLVGLAQAIANKTIIAADTFRNLNVDNVEIFSDLVASLAIFIYPVIQDKINNPIVHLVNRV
jgi:hypothetical protein